MTHRRLLHRFYGARFTGRGDTLHEALDDAWEKAKPRRSEAIAEAQADPENEGVTFDPERFGPDSKQEFVVDEIRIVCQNPVKEYLVSISPD